MSGDGYLPDMGPTGGLKAEPDIVFGGVRVVIDETVVVVVAAHGAHPHDLVAATERSRQYTAGTDPVAAYGEDSLTASDDALVLVYPRVLRAGAAGVTLPPSNGKSRAHT